MPQFAYLMVFIWPVVVYRLFARLPLADAVCWSILGGYLLLPQPLAVSIDLPMLPAIDKNTVPAMSALIAAAAFAAPHGRVTAQAEILPGLWPRQWVVMTLMLVLLLGGVGTVLTNGDPLIFSGHQLAGLRLYDAASMSMATMVELMPFLLARKYLATPAAQLRVVVILATAALAYSLPALWEVRMSPQLSRHIYGYFPHSFAQHIRAGGFRPVVFLHHGLWLAIFFCGGFLATLALWRGAAKANRSRWMIAALWMLMTLVLSKGVGSLAIGLLLGALIVFLPFRLQILWAAALASIILIYPSMRGAGLVPIDSILSAAQSYSEERAASLEYRLRNEDMLLTKAQERPLFGWGSWGRNRVYDEQGEDISVTDGFWIVAIGVRGWVGYLSQVGLLTIPLIMLAFGWRTLGITLPTCGIALALTANLIDMIPNATLTPVTWLLAGALAGRLELGRPREESAEPAEAEKPAVANPYTRQPRRHPSRSRG